MSSLSAASALVKAGVNARLSRILTTGRERAADLGDAGDELFDAAAALLAGGKRTRALLAGLGAALALEGPERDAMLDSALVAGTGAALELYQASALMHDDIIDDASLRRGQPAAHRRLQALHRDRAWLGDARAFGASAAILLGDLLLSTAGEELAAAQARAALSPDRAAAGRAAFDAMTAEVAIGQYLDVRCQQLPPPSPDEDPREAGRRMHRTALEVVRRKSARYSVMHPLLIGALQAGAAPGDPLHERLSVFGEELGIAFQLRDDELGVFGDPALTGKPVGDDLREGKRTVLVALAWERADGEGRALLRSVLARPRAGEADDARAEADIPRAAGLIEACGARAEHEEQIAGHLRAAVAALDPIGPAEISDESRSDLLELARLLCERRA